MAQPSDGPLLDGLQSHTVLRSGRTVSHSAASATAASGSQTHPAPVPTDSSTGVTTAPVFDFTASQVGATSVPRDAAHAHLDFISHTAARATSASTPEVTTPTSNAAYSDFTVRTQAIFTVMKSVEDTNASITRALALIPVYSAYRMPPHGSTR
ncbi:hypothetical protein HPB52_005530 [Rhipicephalus sanguineus]|uniref:Uncharacterized protein n=1 Tax=Rhipicephalus sanguineus TaxID=34632 RepID=A0A9D4Q4X1_RHISA|nr:hypothetical protein HPB52_005530 [Rhipicephalus sanguineus]